MDLPGSTDIALGSPLSVCDTTRHNLWYSLAGLAHRPQKKYPRWKMIMLFVVILFVNRTCCSSFLVFEATRRPTQQSCLSRSKALATNQTGDDQERRHARRIPVLEYRDSWVLLDKPPGITVHRSNGTPKSQRVLTTAVKKQLARKVFPVHRLDHRTSGAILFAFDSKTAGRLHDAAIRKGRKRYFAMLRGEWTYPTSSRLVDVPLTVQGNVTKSARTIFTVLATAKYDSTAGPNDTTNAACCCLVLCEPLTGRTHQIRRHAREIGHPIVGDTEHGVSGVNRFWREKGLDRLALHCWTIDFVWDGEQHSCIAPLSDNLRSVLQGYLPDCWEVATRIEPRLLVETYDIVDGSKGRYFRQRLQDEAE